MSTPSAIQVERIAPAHTALKIAVVTETYPPDINGVAHTLSKIVLGLRERARMLGGILEIDNLPGGGGSVSVRLPLGQNIAP
jgi:hypothetical protein